MKRILLSVLVALICLGTLAPAVGADDSWCATDPSVVIRTPGGNTVVVHVTNYAQGSQHLPALRDAAISHTTQAVPGQAATDVEIQVLVPDDEHATGYPTRSVVSTLPFEGGTVLARDEGKSGKPMKLRFRLDVP